MADIAPLGFAVDTSELVKASAAADTAAVKIVGVADAADSLAGSSKKMGDATKDSTDKVKALGEAHKDAATNITKHKMATDELARAHRQLSSVLDPNFSKIERLTQALSANERLYRSGAESIEVYRMNLQKLWQEMDRVRSRGNPLPTDRQHTLLGEAGRAFTYGIPRFGREARRLIGADQAGFGILRLAGGAALGMGAVEIFRMVSQLPAEMAKAADAEQQLERRFASFGDTTSQAFENASNMMTNLSLTIKDGTNALIDFHNQFNRLGTSAQDQDQAFAAVLAAGRLGGLPDQDRIKNAQQFASIVNKPLVSGADINALQGQNPILVQALAQGMGLGGNVNALQAMASTGQISGQTLLNALVRTSQGLQDQNNKLPKTADELNKQITDEMDKTFSNIGDGLLRGLRQHVELPFFRWLDHLTGGTPAGTPTRGSTTTGLPAAQASPFSTLISNASQSLSHYGSYQTGQSTLSQDLILANQAIAAGTANWAKLDEGQRRAVETLKEYRREIEAQMVSPETPFKKVTEQVDDLTRALGVGGTNDSLIGVWQQALEIQREQERLGHGVAGSLSQIVDQLLALKRAQQAVNDTAELQKLQQAIDSTSAKRGALGLGSYEQQVRAHDIEMQYLLQKRQEIGLGGGSTAAAAASGTLNLTAGVLAGEMTPDGRLSPAGAWGQMQVLPSTAMRPGFGIAPARDGSMAEYNRVGRDYINALYRLYNDPSKAFAAYNAGMGRVNSAVRGGGANWLSMMSPKVQAYVRRAMAAGGAGAAAGGGTDLTNKVMSAQDQEFFQNLDLQSASTLAGLVGNPDAFMRGGAVSGGTIAGLTSQIGVLQAGGTPQAQHQAELAVKITESVKAMAPAYRDAYAAALRLQDVDEQHLQSLQKIQQMNQKAADDRRRGGAAATGDEKTIQALELQLKIEEIRRTARPEDQAGQIAAAQNEAAGASSLAVGGILGNIAKQNDDLQDQFKLVGKTGIELANQQLILKAKKDILDKSNQLTEKEVKDALAEVDALAKVNEQLNKKLDFISTFTGGFEKAFAGVGDAFVAMMSHMEQKGGLHFKLLVRGAEEAFYGLLADLEKKLVVSPILSLLDRLFGQLGNSLADTIFGASVPATGSPTGVLGLAGASGLVFANGRPTSFAMGGAGIFNAPTRFAMGGGVGLAGEGPGTYEGIFPLIRGADGRLGVRSHGTGGGGNTTVNVYDQRGQGAEPVEVQQREFGNGMRQIDVMIRDNTRQNLSSGRMDADMRGAYGISRPAIRR